MKKMETKDNEILDVLNNIRTCLYLILIVLVVNTVFISIGLNNNSSTNNNNNNDQAAVEEDLPEYDVSKYNQIDYSKFKKITSSKGTHVIYIGRETCGYCAMFIPVMNEAQEKYGFKTDYLDISTIFNFSNNSIIDQKAYDEMSNFNDFFKENFLSTPMVVIFKDGKYVDGTIGYQDIQTYSQFLEKNKFKEKQ